MGSEGVSGKAPSFFLAGMDAKALNLLKNRSVEKGFLPTAVEQE